jgi:hypothetical protein
VASQTHLFAIGGSDAKATATDAPKGIQPKN